MQPTNATAVTRPAFNPAQLTSILNNSRLSGVQTRSSPADKQFQFRFDPPSPRQTPASRDPNDAIPPPVYAGIFNPEDLPEALKEDAIFDQTSLEKTWSSVEKHLRTQSLSENEVLRVLISGFLQTDTGKELAPLFVEAIMRSVEPRAGLTPERLREIVEIICHQPASQWADAFGEDVNFPRGGAGVGVLGFIQTQLEFSRTQRLEAIANGELIDDSTWQTLKDFTQQARQQALFAVDGPLHGGPLDDSLCMLEELAAIRPSPEEAKSRVAEFVQAFHEPRAIENESWSFPFLNDVQKVKAQFEGIEIVDNRPQRSLLEEIIDPDVLTASLSKVATPLNAALNALGSMSLQDIGNGLQDAINIVALKAAVFVFRTEVESDPEQELDNTPAPSAFLYSLQEIENKSSFNNNVNTNTLRPDGGIAGAFVYALNAFNVLGGDSALRAALPLVLNSVAPPMKPPAPGDINQAKVPAGAPVASTRSQAEPIVPDNINQAKVPADASASSIWAQVEQLDAEVKDYFGSEPLHPQTGPDSDTGVEPKLAQPPLAGSPLENKNTLEQVTQTIQDALTSIDDWLTRAVTFPPLASANEIDAPLLAMEEALKEGAAVAEHLVYGKTVEPIPSWWESLAPSLYNTLSNLSAVIATYAVGAATAATQLAKDNPRASATAAFVGVSAIYNQLSQQFPEHSPGEIALPFETPAVHQELIEDEIERILEAPVAKGRLSLEDAILELMYDSPESNLLNDEQLINQVALLLQQPSPQVPEKTYFELIHEAQSVTHDDEAPVPPADANLQASKRVKRDAEAEFVSGDAQGDDIEPPLDNAESESTKIALLAEYLQQMDALPSADIDVYEAVDNRPADTAIDAAPQVISLLRRRRHVLWVDSSRAAGDKALIPTYTEALLRVANDPNATPQISVPIHSSFGRCWSNVFLAFQNPFFSEWAAQVGLDLNYVKVNPVDGALTGRVNGSPWECSLTDNSGWAEVAGPILSAIKVVSPENEPVFYPIGSRAAFSLVRAFHRETPALTTVDAQRRASELNTAQAFSPISADDPRSASVESMQEHLGDLYTNSNLVKSLTDLIKDKADHVIVSKSLPGSDFVGLDSCFLSVDRHSSFARAYPEEAERTISAQRYISYNGWKLPENVAEVRKLIEAVTASVPEGPENGNFRGALAYPLPPTTAQQQIIRDTANEFKPNSLGSLYDHLWTGQPGNTLNQALSSPNAVTLGRKLGEKLGAITTPNSEKEWVMTALLLELDATPGEPRNHVGGYNLTQEANWGVKPSTVVTRLTSHLTASGKVSARMAPVAATHLLLANAPEFLVKNKPDNLVCGTHTWATLRMAAARVEQISPGAVAEMTFAQVMAYGATVPINHGDEIAAQMLSVDPLIDWAISQGVIKQSPNGIYSQAQLEIAREKFQTNTENLAVSQKHLTTPTPSRIEFARAELIRTFGKDYPYEAKVLLKTNRPGHETEIYYSMLDLYVTGKLLPYQYHSTSDSLPLANFQAGLSYLKPVTPAFEKQITDYFDNTRSGSKTAVVELLSNLPSEHRKSLEYGNQRFFTVRSSTSVPTNRQTDALIKAEVGHHGILVRSEFKGTVTYYEIFPSTGQIRIRTDLPDDLHLGGKIVNLRAKNAPTISPVQVGTLQKFDVDAYKKGTPPKNGVSSNVIIDELHPLQKQAVFKPKNFDLNTVPNMLSLNTHVNFIASTVVDEHFMSGRDELYSLAKGITDSEQIAETDRMINSFLLGLIPFKSCVENAVQGNTLGAVGDCALDVFGFVIPGVGAAGKISKVAKSGASLASKAFKTTWISSSTLVSAANPLDGLGSLARTAKNAVCKLGVDAYRAVGKGVNQSRKLFGISKFADATELSKRADVASGAFNSAVSGGQAAPVTALFKDGKWYAFDVSRNRPYGAPLENFKPDSSIALERTTFSDGTTALTPSKLPSTEAFTIQRTTGIDVVMGEKVYRYDPTHQTFDDITSPAFHKDLDGYEAVCTLGGRAKRDTTKCFSKVIPPASDPATTQLIAIEHKRLYPATGETPRLVHERRLLDCADPAQPCAPQIISAPMAYKVRTTGKTIDDKHFGLPDKAADPDLEAKTRVVRIDGIIHGLEDAREVRAFVVDVPGRVYGKTTYLVAEADNGLFYYSRYDGGTNSNLEFNKINVGGTDVLANTLLQGYVTAKTPYLHAAPSGHLLSEDFVLLPPLDKLYVDMLAAGTPASDIANIQRTISQLSDKNQREFLIMTWNKGNIRNVEISIPAITIDIKPKPLGFNTRSASDQNQYYADLGKSQVDQHLQVTGLGPANQRATEDALDARRQALTEPVVVTHYSQWGHGPQQQAHMFIKSGAGNCDQMAATAWAVVNANGGSAHVWSTKGHVFTVVGGPPPGAAPTTIDFSGPEFSNAWVVDPWLGFTCKASDYKARFASKLEEWSAAGRQISGYDDKGNYGWFDPNEAHWRGPAVDGPKKLNY